MDKVSKCLWMMSPKLKTVKLDWDDHVPAFNTSQTAQFLFMSNKLPSFQTSGALTNCFTVSVSSRPISRVDNRPNPKRNGVMGHQFLPSSYWDEILACRVVLVGPLRYFSNALTEQSNILSRPSSTKSWSDGTVNSSTLYLVLQGLGLCPKFWHETEGAWLPPSQESNSIWEAIQLTHLFGQSKG